MIVQWKAEKYPPVGQCIYCGATSNLTDEHIIPFALLPKGGDWFLPKASCAACAKVTTKFEDFVCRSMFGPLREQLGLKSRRKKTGLVIGRYNYPDGSLVDKEMPVADFPRVCIGCKWPIPGIILGLSPEREFQGEMVVKWDEETVRNHVTDMQAFRIGRVSPLHFARMLAKIGHAFAVAKYGFDSFEPFLPPVILGQSDNATYLVGGDPTPLADQSVLHDVHRKDVRRNAGPALLGVAIRLFAMNGMPRYHVIVGRRLREAPASEKDGDTWAMHV